MTNKTLIAALLLAAGTASAQISIAAKAHLLFPVSSASWKNLSSTAVRAYDENGKNSAGFNVGISTKVDLPMSFYIMPELYFTTFKNKFTDSYTNTTLEAKSNRIDLPVLAGYKIWGETLSAFLGPVASYNLSSEDTFNDFKENAKTNFTVGFQFGVQAKIRSLLVDARYEGAFSKDQREFLNKNAGGAQYNIQYDSRPSMLMLGLGYQF